MSETMQTQADKDAQHIEDNSPVSFATNTSDDGVKGELPWHAKDDLLEVHNTAGRVGRTVEVSFEDDDGNVRLRFPEK